MCVCLLLNVSPLPSPHIPSSIPCCHFGPSQFEKKDKNDRFLCKPNRCITQHLPLFTHIIQPHFLPINARPNRAHASIEGFCNKIHKSMLKQLKYAHVWGASAKHRPQKVGKEHALVDEDIVQIVKKV
jgi:TGS domain